MNEDLWAKAEKLAARNYSMEFEKDVLSDGQVVYVARNPELPGCKAQGASIDEAKSNLDEARVDYIYALLDENLSVPEPIHLSGSQRKIQVHQNVTQITFSFDTGDDARTKIHETSSRVIQPDEPEYMYSLTLGGDLVEED